MAYTAKAIDGNSWTWLAFGAAVFTSWLVGVSWYLVAKCLMMQAMPQIYNEPRNLDLPTYTLDELREAELLGLQLRIDEAATRNALLVRQLNRTRAFTVASPIIFIGASVAWWAVYRFF